jgi:hypothetical protein
MLETFEELDKCIIAVANSFSSLKDLMSKPIQEKGCGTHGEQETNTGKYGFCHRNLLGEER